MTGSEPGVTKPAALRPRWPVGAGVPILSASRPPRAQRTPATAVDPGRPDRPIPERRRRDVGCPMDPDLLRRCLRLWIHREKRAESIP